MGWQPPLFAHVPLLVEPGGKKLSKRQESVSVQSYRDRGFAPEAVLNYIARLGWSHGDLEIFSQADLARLFTLEGVGSSPSQVHDDKLLWLSQHYIKTLPRERLLAHLQRFLDAEAKRPVPIDDGLDAARRPAARAQQDAGRDGPARALLLRGRARAGSEGVGEVPEARDRRAAARAARRARGAAALGQGGARSAPSPV